MTKRNSTCDGESSVKGTTMATDDGNTNPSTHRCRLECMLEDNGSTWDLSPNDKAAIRWALSSHAILVQIGEFFRHHNPVDPSALFDEDQRLGARPGDRTLGQAVAEHLGQE